MPSIAHLLSRSSGGSEPASSNESTASSNKTQTLVLAIAIPICIILIVIVVFFVFRHQARHKYGPTRGRKPTPTHAKGASTRRMLRTIGMDKKADRMEMRMKREDARGGPWTRRERQRSGPYQGVWLESDHDMTGPREPARVHIKEGGKGQRHGTMRDEDAGRASPPPYLSTDPWQTYQHGTYEVKITGGD